MPSIQVDRLGDARPRWTLLRNSCPCATRRIAPTTWSPTTNARMSRPLLSATNFWISTFCFWLCNSSTMPAADSTDSASSTPMPCVPSSSLMTTGAPTDALDGGQHVLFCRARTWSQECRGMVATQNLQAAQLVARVRDAVGRVRAQHIHLLKLPNDGGPVVGDGRADPRQRRVVVREVFWR
jgi:hypothetical protein